MFKNGIRENGVKIQPNEMEESLDCQKRLFLIRDSHSIIEQVIAEHN